MSPKTVRTSLSPFGNFNNILQYGTLQQDVEKNVLPEQPLTKISRTMQIKVRMSKTSL